MRAQLATHQRKSRTQRSRALILHMCMAFETLRFLAAASVSTRHAQLHFRATESGDGWECCLTDVSVTVTCVRCPVVLCPASNDEEEHPGRVSALQVQCSNVPETLPVVFYIEHIFISSSPRGNFANCWALTPQKAPRAISFPARSACDQCVPIQIDTRGPVPHTGDKIASPQRQSRYQTGHSSRPVPYLTMTVIEEDISGRWWQRSFAGAVQKLCHASGMQRSVERGWMSASCGKPPPACLSGQTYYRAP